jgi:hypothetical protein
MLRETRTQGRPGLLASVRFSVAVPLTSFRTPLLAQSLTGTHTIVTECHP